jgi:hypothetical protein
MPDHIRENIITAAWGLFGVSVNGGAFYVSFLPHLEAWMRLLSLTLAIGISVFTIVKILKNKKD